MPKNYVFQREDDTILAFSKHQDVLDAWVEKGDDFAKDGFVNSHDDFVGCITFQIHPCFDMEEVEKGLRDIAFEVIMNNALKELAERVAKSSQTWAAVNPNSLYSQSMEKIMRRRAVDQEISRRLKAAGVCEEDDCLICGDKRANIIAEVGREFNNGVATSLGIDLKRIEADLNRSLFSDKREYTLFRW